MKNIIYFVLLIAVISSCSKEKTAYENLDGNWKLSAIKINGNTVFTNLEDERYSFDNSSKKGVYYLNEINPQNFDYKLTDNDSYLSLAFSEISNDTYKILSLSEDKLVLYDKQIGIETGDITETEKTFSKM